jgi:catalase
MIALAEEADEEYCRLLREGFANARKARSSQKPLGNRNGDQAPETAINTGQSTEPY